MNNSYDITLIIPERFPSGEAVGSIFGYHNLLVLFEKFINEQGHEFQEAVGDRKVWIVK